MPTRIESGDAARIAQQLGAAGTPAPSWVRDDPKYSAAYDKGAGRTVAAVNPPPASASTTAPRPRAVQPKKGDKRGGELSLLRAKRAEGRYDGIDPDEWAALQERAREVDAAPAEEDVPARSHSGGDGGGLLLALILFPIAQSILRYGAAGPAVWFRAKWLNKTANDNDTAASTQQPATRQNTAGASPKAQLTPRQVKVGSTTGGPQHVR